MPQLSLRPAVAGMAILDGKAFKWRMAIYAGIIMLANTATLRPADAQSRVCTQLQNQLSALSTGRVSNSQKGSRYRQYERAAKSQRVQINKTRKMAKRNGCQNKFFRRSNAAACGRILSSLDEMGANLAVLEQGLKRLSTATPRTGNRKQRNIIRKMNKRGCFASGNQQASAKSVARRRSVIEQIFGVRTFGNDGRRRTFEGPDAAFSGRYNTYRTMCVRKEDGYYFPVSFSTTPDRFEFDERICQSKCQGTEVALYYHAMPSEASEDMVSFRGQIPYLKLPSAFKYRKKFDAGITCRYTSGTLQEVAGTRGAKLSAADLRKSSLTRVGKPVFRQDRSLDPETLSNLAGQFEETDLKRLLLSPQDIEKARALALDGRKVRVVGPAFYPVQ